MATKRKFSTMTQLSTINLESSMNSTQGLLSFMTDASKQIKTYLDEDDQKDGKQQKQRKHLLQQLNSLTVRIPNINSQLQNSFNASYNTSLNSSTNFTSGQLNDDTINNFSSCCMTENRKRKTSINQYSNLAKKQRENSCSYEYTGFNPKLQNTNEGCFEETFDHIVPSPTPDFDDLVNCMITDEFASPFDYSFYLSN